MRWTLRTKVFILALVTGATFAALLVLGGAMERRIVTELDVIRSRHVPQLDLGPRLRRSYEQLPRAYQDAVAAQDLDALEQVESLKKRLLEDLDRGEGLVGADVLARAKSAVERYHQTAVSVSRKMIAGDTGEDLVAAVERMQAQQREAEEAIAAASQVDTVALANAFSRAGKNLTALARVRFALSVACMFVVLIVGGLTMRGILGSVHALGQGIERFGRGDFSEHIVVRGNDELTGLARQANAMAEQLQRLHRDRADAEWVQRGRVGLAEAIGRDLDVTGVCERALRFVADYVEAPTGVLYAVDDDGALVRRARFAGAETGGEVAARLTKGQGLPGQAMERSGLWIVESLPAAYLRVLSGTGEAACTHLALLTLRHLDEVVGVLELGFFSPPSAPMRELLGRSEELLATALDAARARGRLRDLLVKTQHQAERLAAQEEELRATNDELLSQQRNLQDANRALEARTEELGAQQRALEQANDELRHARESVEAKARQLAEVSEYKSRFLANMSHELRTPLNGMLLLSSLMAENAEGNLTERQVGFCKTIHAAGQDLLVLIEQVLDLAKVEAGKYDLHVASFELADLYVHMRSMFEPMANNKGLAFSVDVDASVPAALTSDRRRVEQVLKNLLGNAIKFTSAGSVALRVTSSPDDAIVFEVSDTGIGISEENRTKVFEAFEQVEQATDRKYSGTGLGLSISRELAQLLGGRLELESESGKGSTFRLVLPLAPPAGATMATTQEPGDRPDAGKRPSEPVPVATHATVVDDRATLVAGDPHVLVIEDDAAFANMVGDIAREQGFRVTIALTGAEGLDLAQQLRPRGILLDIRLPDTDGFALLAKLRQDTRTHHIPVHVISGLDVASRARAAGAIGYLRKPADRAEMAQALMQLVPDKGSSPHSVLLVEDDPEEAKSVEEALDHALYDLTCVGTGKDALEQLDTSRFDCMLLDLGLPDMDGLEVMAAMSERLAGRAGPAVVVYTGRPLTRAETKQLERYADSVVLKGGETGLRRLMDEVRLFTRSLTRTRPDRSVCTTDVSELRLEGRRILLTDDDMRTVYALSAVLRAKGAEVLTADTGQAALDILAEDPNVDVVLMDIMMPEMDGYEAMRRIREDSRLLNLPIIALTAKAMMGDRQRCLEAGASDYMSKPVDPKRLVAVVASMLEQKASA